MPFDGFPGVGGGGLGMDECGWMEGVWWIRMDCVGKLTYWKAVL